MSSENFTNVAPSSNMVNLMGLVQKRTSGEIDGKEKISQPKSQCGEIFLPKITVLDLLQITYDRL
jgi:hypothetical protein